MTNNLRVVILGLVAIVFLLVGGIVAIAIVQTVQGDDVDIPAALLTLVGTPLGALVGILVPTRVNAQGGR
jgi:hypothetical protein